ncbi:MAG TPA: lysylphosphatidylglycerol synthase transmembrane domain-containing protein [Lentimicrobium sp.]|nr:lysylphosphatidylglycerol synthase transmembrane domain-containing protein [Lentimicrobium sp.]
MNKKTWSTILKIVGSIAILAFLVTRVDWNIGQFKLVFKTIDLTWYIISLTGVIIVLFLKSIRWNLLLRHENCVYPFKSAFAVYMSSFTIGLLTPGRLGEIARLYYIREERNISFFNSFKTIVIDRIFDFAILIWFGASGLVFFYKVSGNFSPLFYLSCVGILMFTFWFAIAVTIKSIKSGKIYFTFLKEAWNNMFAGRMIYPWILTLISYFFYYLANWFILKSLVKEISLVEMGFIMSVMSLVTLIPVTIAGFGTREVSLVFLFSFYGIGPETAIIFSLLQFIAFFLWGGIIGWVFWLIKPVKMALIRQDASRLVSMLK